MNELVKLLLLEKGFDPQQGTMASGEAINNVLHGRDEGMILLDGPTTQRVEISDRVPLSLGYEFDSIAIAKEDQEMVYYSPAETIRNRKERRCPLPPQVSMIENDDRFNDGAVAVGNHLKFMLLEGHNYTVTLQTPSDVPWRYLPKADLNGTQFLKAVAEAVSLEGIQAWQGNPEELQGSWYTGTLSGLEVSLSSNHDRHLLVFHKPGMWADNLREMMIKAAQQFSCISAPVQDFPPGTVRSHYTLPQHITSAAVAEVERGLGFQIPAYLSRVAERLR